MKRILLLSFVTLLTFSAALAAHDHSVLNVSLNGHQPIVITLDGYRYSPFEAHKRLENVEPGWHHLKVVTLVRNPYGWGATRMVVYNGRIHISPAQEVHATVNHHHRLVVSTAPLYPVHDGGYGQPGCSDGTYGNVAPAPMGHLAFRDLKNVIRSKSFESTRKDIAIQALSTNYMTSSQVSELLRLFSFESTKLQVAKKAYASVVDTQSYYLVHTAFNFESSITSLNRYIANNY